MSPEQFFKSSAVFYFLVAFGWELFEMVGDTIFINSNALIDTFIWDGVTDIVIGYIGLYVGYYYLEHIL